ncbi:MAG TPA: transcriptional repressor [bacterium]
MGPRDYKKYRNSKQRAKILELLRTTKSHPTAIWVYENLRKEFPSLSLGNVYRNLNILVELGAVQELKFGSTFDRYDGNVQPHYHFICEQCSEIQDLNLDQDHIINSRVEELINCRVYHHRLEFYGVCGKCGGEGNRKTLRAKGDI